MPVSVLHLSVIPLSRGVLKYATASSMLIYLRLICFFHLLYRLFSICTRPVAKELARRFIEIISSKTWLLLLLLDIVANIQY